MIKYFVNYLIVIMMMITSIITFTTKKLRDDQTLLIFAFIWFSFALIYTIRTTRDFIIYLQINIDKEKNE